MKNNLFSPTSCEDDVSDSLSSTHSFSHLSTEAVPFSQHLSELHLTDPISSETKKIRKKRNAYGKIDDDKRIQLLEAVQVRGETLKAASKRLDINYSSAKSIIHTYRKEGRILKKSVCSLPYGKLDNPFENFFQAKSLQAKTSNFPGTLNYLDLHQSSTAASSLSDNSGSSPMIDLSGALGHLGMINQERSSEWPQSFSFETSPPSKFSLKQSPISQERNFKGPKIPMLDEVEEQPPTHSNEVLKRLDSFYMNYSDSPLSGGKGNIYHDDSNTNRGNPKEFDSFSELVNSFQNPSYVNNFCQYQNGEINWTN